MDVITTHINADFDCLGAMLAARRLYPGALLVFPGAQEQSVRDFLSRHPQQAALFIRLRDIDVSLIHRLILVDVRHSDRIGPFDKVAQRPDVELHIYDHHPDARGDLHGHQEWVEPVGSTVTVMTQLFFKQGITPTPEEATVMMIGLYEDTGSLLFSSTTENDFVAAAFLLRNGANLNVVADSLVQKMTVDQVELLHLLLNGRTTLQVNGIDVTIAQATFPRFVGDIAFLAHRIKEMESLDALIVVVQMGERIFMVGRSRRPDVAVGEILSEFGGGGHRQAASATVKDQTLVQVLDRLPNILMRHVKPCWEARHLMTSPVKTVPVSAPVRQVRELLTRYNINAAPVIDGDKVVGILTRQIVDKAAQHGLAEVVASDYMIREFATATPSTAIDDLKELIVERNQRFVPVVSDNRLVGAITRTDLLRHLVSGNRALPLTGPVWGGGLFFKKRQLERLLREQLPERILSLLRQMGEVAESLDMRIFAVGGFVRDLLLQQPNLDIDVVVEGDGILFAETFARLHQARVRAHAKFSTAIIVFPDGFKVDVATTRMEYYLKPGALPTVEYASLKLDLCRRDFTVNTLALSLNQSHFGELYDFFGGQGDLSSRVIRVLHNLSFVEDATRVFRAIRFEQRLGFKLGAQTESLLRSAVRMGFIHKVGGARLFSELTAILRESEPFPAVQRMSQLDLLQYLHAELKLSKAAENLFKAAAHTLHWHELLYTGEQVERWQVYYLCLTAELTDQASQEMAKQLLMPIKVARVIIDGRVAAHKLLAILRRRHKRGVEPKPSELYHWFSPLATPVLLYLTARAGNDEIRRWVSHYFIHLRNVIPQLSGADLKAMGFKPGPSFQNMLSVLRDAKLDHKVVSRIDEIAFIKKRYLLDMNSDRVYSNPKMSLKVGSESTGE